MACAESGIRPEDMAMAIVCRGGLQGTRVGLRVRQVNRAVAGVHAFGLGASWHDI